MTRKDDRQPEKKPPKDETARRTSVPVDDEEVEHERPLDWRLTLRLLSFLGPYKLRMTWNVLLVALSSATMLLGAFAFRQVFRYIEWGATFRMEFNLWVAALALNALVVWQVHFRREMSMTRLGQRVLFDLRMTIFRHLQKLSLSYYDRTKQGWIISRATSDLGTLEDVIAFAIPEIALAVFMITGGTVMVILVEPVLAWLLAVMAVLMVIITFFFHHPMVRAWREVRTQVSRICANLAENIAGVRVVQAFTRERHNLREFDRLNEEYYNARVRATIVHTLYFPSMGILTAVTMAAVILLYGHKAQAAVTAGGPAIEINNMILVFALLRMFFEPIRHLSNLYGTALGAMAAGERIFQLLDTVPDVKDRPDAAVLGPVTGRVRMEDVTFGYDPAKPVLEKIDLDAKPGQTVAFVGPTGAGKSSIINLVCRFYEQQEGRITVDDVDIRDVTMHSLRSQMGIVMQEPFLFSGTVMDNIKFGRPEAADEEVYEAAKVIGAHDVIAALRDGYQTQVQERGEGLSGGERQLVCFTRAMVADPRILVLDEATSSVDTGTELRIQNALDHLVRKRTSFVVAHRLSTVRNAHQVLVVKDGRIVERGTHDDLLARGGEYARMYREFLREG
ncbi:MAG TPA: ABC transporter ATP-binding protein [Planctomycetota bacterium]|nr:ABC transporter ATP-binding protein [Planctomycetota bacterium]